MMRDDHIPDLRAAFPEMPDMCHDALMTAVRSVKEEEPVRKTTFRAVLIAAAIIVATMAMAVAASGLFGWTDFFAGYGNNILPDTARKIMSESWNTHAFTLGNVTFTTRELYCDGYIAMAATEITTADSSEALFASEPWDPIGANGDNGKQVAAQLGVEPSATWVEAAQQLGKKLYHVRAILEMPEDLMGDGGMEDPLFTENGLTYFSMAFMNGKAQGEKVDATLFLRVAEIDPATGEDVSKETAREAIAIPLEAPMEQATYKPAAAFAPGGYTFTGARATLMPAGLYIYADFTAPVSVKTDTMPDDLYMLWGNESPAWLDANGNRYPTGANLSSYLNIDNFPHVVYEDMLPLGEMPEKLILEVNGERVEVVR